jgi:hypothetical protein
MVKSRSSRFDGSNLNTWQQNPSEQDFALDKLFFFTADTLLEGCA